VNPTKQSLAPVVKHPAELEPATTGYIEDDVKAGRRDESAEWLWLLWERRRFLWRAAVSGLLLSMLIAFVIPKRYESTTQLMPPDSQSHSGAAMLLALAGKSSPALSAFAGDLLGVKNSGALFTEILRSRTVEDRLVDRFDLRKVYGVRYWQDARKKLNANTDVSEDRKSGVITITVTDRTPQRAAQMARAYIEELDRLVAQVSTSSARRERIFIEQRLVNVKQDLDNASRQFSEYASQNTTIDITAQGKAMVEGAARLQGELIAVESERQGLEQIYTGNNVRVRALRARAEELHRQLQKLGGDSSEPASSDSNPQQQDFPSIRKLPLLGVKWFDLYRQTKIQETVYEFLTQQYELAKIEEAKEIPTVKVLDSPNVPEKKAFPPRMLIIFLGTCLTFSFATAWVLGLAVWKETDPQDPRKALAQEVLQHFKTQVSPASPNGSRFWRAKEKIFPRRNGDRGIS
jgi:capsule polysaccharide export protein KpsE/RkpR